MSYRGQEPRWVLGEVFGGRLKMETQLIQLKEGVWEDGRRESGSLRQRPDVCKQPRERKGHGIFKTITPEWVPRKTVEENRKNPKG